MAAGEGPAGPLVPPGGWPGDPAGPDTPVAGSAAEVADLAGGAVTLDELVARQSVCRACPRLVAWREEIAVVRRRSFRDERYWGRPIPGWGSARPRLLIVGLAPAAHGGNRTGRIFTGDRSGDFLFASLYRCGWLEKPTSVALGRRPAPSGCRMAAAVRCAPPENKPEPAERETRARHGLSPNSVGSRAEGVDDRVPGGIRLGRPWPVLGQCGFALPRPRPAFGHGAEVRLKNPQAADEVTLIGCYHPSQQNTFTGRVTPAMLDAIFTRARVYAYPETERPVT